MFTSLVKVDSGLSCGRAPISLALMASVLPPMVTAGLAVDLYKTSYAMEMAAALLARPY
jgi:hypothetical protein